MASLVFIWVANNQCWDKKQFSLFHSLEYNKWSQVRAVRDQLFALKLMENAFEIVLKVDPRVIYFSSVLLRFLNLKFYCCLFMVFQASLEVLLVNLLSCILKEKGLNKNTENDSKTFIQKLNRLMRIYFICIYALKIERGQQSSVQKSIIAVVLK